MAESDAARSFTVGPSANVNLQTTQARTEIDAMAAAMKGLEKSLQQFANNSYIITEKINRQLKEMGKTAATVAGQMGAVTAAMGGTTAAAKGATGGTGSGSGWLSSAVSQAGSYVNTKTTGALNTPILPFGLSLGTFLGTGGGDDTAGFLKDAALAPFRYLRSRINTNRDTAIMGSGALSMVGRQQGQGTDQLMSSLAKFPGSIYGTPQDLLGLFSQAPALGASFGFAGAEYGTTGGQGVRAAGFLKGIREMQMLNPIAPVGQLMGELGGFAGNTGAQQRGQMLTGGAMSMIGAGGRQKSLSEWAESILKWFEGLRPGAKRNTPFGHGELMAQYFPGSNIDAWFNATGVPQNMRDYWWTYALGKASHVAKGGPGEFTIGGDEGNVAWQRLRSSSELTRTEFSLAGQMAPQYAQREGADRWFNKLMGQLQTTLIPALTNSILGFMQFIPDSLEDLLMTGVERGAAEVFGDVGDVGDSYGEMGGNSTSGLHPDMKKRVGAMMRANPSLRVNSGLRDTGLQQKLRAKGHSRVSGKPSAHTRGMAADLGPSSQYGWISRNAGRFGLASGKGHGEPWHVGMKGTVPGVGDVDIGEIWDDFDTGFFDKFLDKMGLNSPEGMAGMVSKLIEKLFGALSGIGVRDAPFGGGTADEMFNRLAGKTSIGIGLKPKTTTTDTGSVAPGALTGGGEVGATLRDFFTQVLSGLGANATDLNLAKMGAVAKQEGYRAGAYNPWNSDSGPGTDHNSQGIKNYPDAATGVAQTIKLLSSPTRNRPAMLANLVNDGSFEDFIEETEAFYHTWDPSAQIAPNQSQGAAYLSTGLGDVERAAMLMGPSRGSNRMVFNNTFNIQGGVGGYGGGSNGGIDLRRTVTQIADHLEDEMNRRLKRSA